MVRTVGCRLLAALVLAGAILPAVTSAASAHGRVLLGFHFGLPFLWGYHHAPAVIYAPPPVYDAPAPRVAVRACRNWHGNATVDATGERFYGRACLLSDGRWHIVERY